MNTRFLVLALGGTIALAACNPTDDGERDDGAGGTPTEGGSVNVYPRTGPGTGAGGGESGSGGGGGTTNDGDAGFGGLDAGFGSLDAGFGSFDAGFGSFDAGFGSFDAGFGSFDAGFFGLDAGTSTNALLGDVSRPSDVGTSLDRGRTGTLRALTEAQAAALLNAVNAGELALAAAALPRLGDEETRTFAERMVADHTALQERAAKLLEQRGLAPEPNSVSQALETSTQQLIDSLATLSGPELDRAYARAQLAMHQQALGLIDCVLSPAMQDGALQEFLRETVRASVAKHLEHAAELTTSLGAADRRERVGDAPAECSTACTTGLFDEGLRAAACSP